MSAIDKGKHHYFKFNCPSSPMHGLIFGMTARARCISTLESEIKKIDAEYDKCNETWAQGEMDQFRSDKFLGFMMINHDKPRLLHYVMYVFLVRTIPSPLTSIMLSLLCHSTLGCFPDLLRFYNMAEKAMKDATFVPGSKTGFHIKSGLSWSIHLITSIFNDSKHLKFNKSKNESNRFKNIR